jgi:uncharacterized LabA/DUF88 family protein
MKTAFVVDGFNLYHSLVSASKSLGYADERGTKWLDLWGLCNSYLSALGGGATMAGVYYFSALATHLEASKPGVVDRHRTYIACLGATGVTVEPLGKFKKKPTRCRHCNKGMKLREEKETDVALGVKLLELLHNQTAEQVVLVTGDTDVAPAVRAAHRMFPGATVCFAFPWDRRNDELSKCVKTCIQITREAYVRHQLDDPHVVGAKSFAKPASW